MYVCYHDGDNVLSGIMMLTSPVAALVNPVSCRKTGFTRQIHYFPFFCSKILIALKSYDWIRNRKKKNNKKKTKKQKKKNIFFFGNFSFSKPYKLQKIALSYERNRNL